MTALVFLLILLQENSAPQPAEKPKVEETIVVSGIRADEKTPVTKSNVEKEDIQREYHNQDIPLLLRDTPSINAYTEAGVGGSGYSYITLRGVSPTRLNFSLDGVPLEDSEDNGTYFADFPDLARSLQSIQVQRGVGTSTFGNASFGGSVNMESIALSQQGETTANLGAGSFGQKYGSVGWQSGLMQSGLEIYSRLSLLQNDGYREHSGAQQRNLFVSAAKSSDKSQLKLTGFSGHEHQQMSFYASDADTLRINRRDNPLSPDDRDSFGYDLANLQYLRSFSASTNLSASAYYQRGYGAYTLSGDQYGLDGRLLGALVTMDWSRGALSANYGVHVNRFVRYHTLDAVATGERAYTNYGVKPEENAFAKFNYSANRWNVYTDLQLRSTRFSYHGDVAIEPIRWTFFNPKLGARYSLSAASSVYASAGLTTREPTRNDLFQGEDNATIAHDLHAVVPERLYDFETGWNYVAHGTNVAVNLYAMEFRHEIAATGELSDIGLELRRNVDRSYRRGVEVDARFAPTQRLELRTAANISRNRIQSWTQSYDVYDDAGDFVESRTLAHHDVNPLLTPPVLVNQSLDYAVTSKLTLGAVARYASKSYLDNTSNDGFVAPSWLVFDGRAAFALPHASKLTLSVNNLTNRKRVYPSGYSYLTMTPSGVIGGTSYYYPQATRNFVLMLDTKL